MFGRYSLIFERVRVISEKHLENIQLPSDVFGMFQVSLFHLVLPSLDKSVSVLTSDIFVLILTVVFQINL